MALPKEPRQKMINLMYLVLTALLALNVSAEILNAFKTVNNSLLTANGTIDAKNKDLFSSFDQKLKDPTTADRAKQWYPKAEAAKQLSDEMINYIEGIKTDIMKAAGYNPAKGDTTYNEDNLEATTRVMSDPGTKGNELKKKLDEFKSKILSLDASISKEFANLLPINTALPQSVNAASKKDWGTAYFNMVPAIAAITILSKFQNDVKNSEAMVVDYCHRQVGNVIFVINKYQPLVGQSSNYLMPGQELTITAGIGAYNSAAQPKITIDGSPVSLNANGVAEFKSTVGGTGSYTKTVHINYINQSTGKQESVDYPVTYTVGSPTGTSVSADDVKVLYIGLDNHLSVSSNVGDEKIHASMDNGNLTKTAPGKYIAQPGKPGEATIHLNVDGKPQDVKFRVKTVPDPVAKVGNSKGGTMKANEFKAQFGVRADLENFVFEGVKFNVQGYTIVFNGAGFPTLKAQQVNGASFDPVRNLIEQARPGTTVSIDEIRVQGPGGGRKLPPIVFNLTP